MVVVQRPASYEVVGTSVEVAMRDGVTIAVSSAVPAHATATPPRPVQDSWWNTRRTSCCAISTTAKPTSSPCVATTQSFRPCVGSVDPVGTAYHVMLPPGWPRRRRPDRVARRAAVADIASRFSGERFGGQTSYRWRASGPIIGRDRAATPGGVVYSRARRTKNCRDPTLWSPGGLGDTELDGGTCPLVAHVHATTTWTTSVCTGAIYLAAAGHSRRYGRDDTLDAQGTPRELGARYTAERVVERGKVITAAGVSSGIDMALTLVARSGRQGDGTAGPARDRVRPAAAVRRRLAD